MLIDGVVDGTCSDFKGDEKEPKKRTGEPKSLQVSHPRKGPFDRVSPLSFQIKVDPPATLFSSFFHPSSVVWCVSIFSLKCIPFFISDKQEDSTEESSERSEGVVCVEPLQTEKSSTVFHYRFLSPSCLRPEYCSTIRIGSEDGHVFQLPPLVTRRDKKKKGIYTAHAYFKNPASVCRSRRPKMSKTRRQTTTRLV